MHIIGCDPGVTGALALISEGKLIAWADMPVTELPGKRKLTYDQQGMPVESVGVNRVIDPFGVCRVMLKWKEMARGKAVTLVIEKMWSRAGQASASNDKLLYGAGLVSGVAVGLGFRLEQVAPATWKARLGVKADKTTSLDLIREIVKDDPSQLAVFKRKKDNGRAEAALIGIWGWRNIA